MLRENTGKRMRFPGPKFDQTSPPAYQDDRACATWGMSTSRPPSLLCPECREPVSVFDDRLVYCVNCGNLFDYAWAVPTPPVPMYQAHARR